MSHLPLIRMEGDCFSYKIGFDGVNFPAKSPVLEKTTKKCAPSTEKMYVRDGVPKLILVCQGRPREGLTKKQDDNKQKKSGSFFFCLSVVFIKKETMMYLKLVFDISV